MNASEILKEVLREIKPTESEIQEIKREVERVVKKVESNLKKHKINAEIFVGGSFAKGTLIKKDKYDVDVFLRFAFEKDMVKAEKAIEGIEEVNVVHGSRDYYDIKINNKIVLELIPVFKIKNYKEAKNVTDLSYSHVKYINKKVDEKIRDEIRLAKAFCHSAKCYGAESYIRGFSGYGLELLIYNYRNFIKFVKVMANTGDKIVLDIEKDYKNKKQILMDINESKLGSPIILVDPTFKTRNVLAALSEETFERFKRHCHMFLKKPSKELFENSKEDFEKMKKEAIKKKQDFVIYEIETDRQEGDIAGSKLLKFNNFFIKELEKFYDVKKSSFEYYDGKIAKGAISLVKKKEIIYNGPVLKDKENVQKFKKMHKRTYTKNDRIYASEKVKDIKAFMLDWMNDNSRRMNEMSIVSFKILDN